MEQYLTTDWRHLLEEEFAQDYYKKMKAFLLVEYEERTIFPKKEDVFRALQLTPYNKTKVVILGQDPYHGQGQAHGLSFSVQTGERIPPSLKNIYKEQEEDLQITAAKHGCLENWAKEGVLLLNNVLTVEANMAHSHKGKGWEQLTDKIISLLNKREEPIVFILWGRHAEKKGEIITNTQHLIIHSAHPSPLSARRGFFGSKPFSKTNQFLQETGQKPVNWEL